MSDPLDNLSRGDPIPNQMETWNAMLEASRAHRDAKAGQGGVADQTSYSRQSGVVRVKNTTGSAVGRFGTLKLSAPMVLPADRLDEFKARVMFDGAAIAATTDPFCVFLEPVAAGAIAPAVVFGVTVASVSVTDSTHGFAGPAIGVTATLASGTSGPAKILYKESGTGAKWAVVLLLGSSPGGSIGGEYEDVGPSFSLIDKGHGTYVKVKASPDGVVKDTGLRLTNPVGSELVIALNPANGDNGGAVSGDEQLFYGLKKFRDALSISVANSPATSSSAGVTGQIGWDTNYIYVCVSTGSWMRVALSSF